jgi:hypothetical protein
MVKKETIKKFRIFSSGINRLEKLKKALNSLNTRKFKKEELAIRRKLDDVSKIPEIEEDIRRLKLKIAGVDVDSQESLIDKKQEKSIRRLSHEENLIEGILVSFKRKVAHVNHELKRAEALARKKELTRSEKKEVDNIPAIRSRINSLKRLLIENSSKIEEQMRRKKLYGKSKIAHEIKGIESIDANQEMRLGFLKREIDNLNRIMVPIFERVNALEGDIRRAQNKTSQKLTKLESEVEKPEWYAKGRVMRDKIREKFNIYSHGVRRLRELERELDSLNTDKFQKDEKLIRRKLKSVSLIPEIEEDLRELKLKIAGVDVASEKAIIDRKQDRVIRRMIHNQRVLHDENSEIPRIKRRESFFRRLLGGEKQEIQKMQSQVLEIPRIKRKESRLKGLLNRENEEIQKIEGEVSEIPLLKKKAGFLSRLFKKEESEIKAIENKLDSSTLKFNQTLLQDMADSKRMIEEEKYELRKHLLDALAHSIQELNKEKEESDKKILSEIEKLRTEMQMNNKDANQNMISKIVQLRQKLNESKRELQEEITGELDELKQKVEKKVEEKKEEKSEEPKKKISEDFSKQFKPVKLEETKPTAFNELAPISEVPLMSDIPSIPIFVPLHKNSRKLKPIKIHEKKKRIPNTIFLEDFRVNNISSILAGFKKLLKEGEAILSKDIAIKKAVHDRGIERCTNEVEKINKNFSEISSIFPKHH